MSNLLDGNIDLVPFECPTCGLTLRGLPSYDGVHSIPLVPAGEPGRQCPDKAAPTEALTAFPGPPTR